jgi:hypothetical protein
MIKALVAFNSDWVLEDDKEVIARVGPTFFHDKGCIWRYRYRPIRKDGKGRVQDFKEVSKDEFLLLFPSALEASRNVIKTKEEVLELVFPNDRYHRYVETNSLENLWAVIWRSYTREDQQTIIKIYLERVNSLKVDIPTKLFNQIGIRW